MAAQTVSGVAAEAVKNTTPAVDTRCPAKVWAAVVDTLTPLWIWVGELGRSGQPYRWCGRSPVVVRTAG
ncbi:hypothetical protein Aglo01_34290 [Actinokineospora globicatena]|uniref:Uncharacterized protein n=1 Tax=Actinokineospora globicatena TaxID=103729 RepID=A0A9W6V4T9_9PSEU|nr:hypothetical protein Aglo01_34290 [Actinokineospora globicatena]GLW89585.1 hypothetical protein Aglo03_04010 [Actinokineospora globicatena]